MNSKIYTQQLILRELVDTMEDRFEYIGGEVYMMSPSPSPKHQTIVYNIGLMIGDYKRRNELGFKVFSSPIDTYLLNDTNYVQPDIIVVHDTRKIGDDGIYGAPDLVVEVTSPNTLEKDSELKLSLYREAGVREYWIVDYENNQIKVYNFADNTYWNGSFSDTIQSKFFSGLEFNFKIIKERADELYLSKSFNI